MLCCLCQGCRFSANTSAVTVMDGDALCSFHARERIELIKIEKRGQR